MLKRETCMNNMSDLIPIRLLGVYADTNINLILFIYIYIYIILFHIIW